MRTLQRLLRIGLSGAALLLFWGCTTGNDSQPKFDKATGQHPANWQQTHWVDYLKNPEQCRSCHGSTTDKAGAGGTSNVSCFTCHPDGPGHASDWGQGLKHGRIGAQAEASNSAGMAACFTCHGMAEPNGNFIKTCVACHTKAPHPDRPWNGATADKSNHTFTHVSNAGTCALCHLNGANSTKKPSIPAPAGTTPGCFNNTLCHGKGL